MPDDPQSELAAMSRAASQRASANVLLLLGAVIAAPPLLLSGAAARDGLHTLDADTLQGVGGMLLVGGLAFGLGVRERRAAARLEAETIDKAPDAAPLEARRRELGRVRPGRILVLLAILLLVPAVALGVFGAGILGVARLFGPGGGGP